MNRLVILFCLFFFSTLTFSQEWKFGVFVDPQFSWFTPDIKNLENDGTRFSIKGGLEADRFFAKNYAVTTGISINNAGGKVLYDNNLVLHLKDGDTTLPALSSVKYKLQYISIPLGLKLKSNEIGYFTFYADLGFTASVNIKAQVDVEGTDITDTGIKDDIRLFNLSYYFGGGLEYSLGGSTAINAGIVFNNGFLDILNNENLDSKDVMKILSIRVGVMF